MTITVIVDDSDPAIEYSGPWTTLQPSSLNLNGIAHSIGNTLHGTNDTTVQLGAVPSFLYNFSGSSVSVFLLVVPDVVNGLSLPYPWDCIVDGNVTVPLALQHIEEPATIKICDASDLQDGPHQLDFSFSRGISDSIGYLDYIAYTPTASTTPRIYGYTEISFDDPMIRYSSVLTEGTFTPDKTFGISIFVPNTTAQLNFTGSSLTWIGFLGPGSNATATYSIDEQPPIEFELPTSVQLTALNNATLLLEPGQIYFETPSLDPEEHQFTIWYNGGLSTEQNVPLYIQSIVIGNGTVPASITNGTVSASGTTVTTASTALPSTPTTPVTSQTKSFLVRTRPIIAGTLSGVALMFIIISAFICHRRRRRHKLRHPLTLASQPFISHPNTLLARLLTSPGVSAQEIKGRRRLIPQAREASRIPPSKLTAHHESTEAPVPPRPEPEPASVSAPEVNDTVEANDADTPAPVGPVEIIGIQEEDSGLRMVENVGAEGERFIHVLPPVYSAV
ncbi:hypothetical protein HYPSUDRAFT_427637 [Hypholoma sublateritium FD-334 SS-4]|uniref:Uncharacterized protein n=1 Tax=Hypholoma sublateritium (strain FD-334 SS-4) TaxID=945553 RepID=A0A0D2NDP6_HYPSF|nr:hypothetical protein HYPSUDRAFT_427637 [Hypholoma sublateritium FD-334 SS-4]